MIKIAICDDERRFVDQIRDILEECCEEIGQMVYIEGFYDGRMLLDQYSCQFDVVFLDIRMPQMDSMEAAKKIRERDPNVTIVFLTSVIDWAIKGYDVKAANYLRKPVKKEKLICEIDAWIENTRMKKQECLLVENKEGQFRIPIGLISYVETYDRNLLIHTEKREIVCYKKLKQIKERLEPYGFAQSHKGILVNMSFVNNISGNEIVLITKDKLQISRSMKKEFMQRLAVYLGGKL